MSELKAIVEALIFASPEPVTIKALGKLLDGEPKEDVEAAAASAAVVRMVSGLLWPAVSA